MKKLILGSVLAIGLLCTMTPEANARGYYRGSYGRPGTYYRTRVYRSYCYPRYSYRPYRYYAPRYCSPRYYYRSYPVYHQAAPSYYAPGYGWGGHVTVWW